jgi:MFS family permease
MGISIVDIGLPDFNLMLGGDLISFGIIISIFSITQAFFQFPFAAASDKLGRRHVILIGILIYIIGTFLCYFAQNIVQLVIFRAIQGAGAYTSILQAIIGDIFPKDQHGKGMGLYSLSMNIGYFGGIILGGYISTFLGFRSIFLVNGIIVSVSSIFLFSILKDKNQEPRLGPKGRNSQKMGLNLTNIKTLITEPQYITAVTLNCVRWFLFGGIVAYLIWVLEIHFEVSPINTSYLLIVIVAIYVCFVLISSRILDSKGPRKVMLIGHLIVLFFGITFFIDDLANNLLIFLIVVIFIGIGLALFDPAGNTLLLKVIEDIDPELKGTGIGFNNSIGFFMGAIAPVIISSIGEVNVFFPFYMIMVLMSISLMIILFLVRKTY